MCSRIRKLRATSSALLVCAVATLLLITANAQADEPIIAGIEFVCYEDGGCEEFYLIRDKKTGALKPYRGDIFSLLGSRSKAHPARKDVSITPRPFFRYPEMNGEIEELRFYLNTLSNQRRELFQRTLDELVNKFRGTRRKPIVVFDDTVIDTSGYSAEQFAQDGLNTLYVHEDDRTWDPYYFNRPTGMARVYVDYQSYTFIGCDITYTYNNFTTQNEDRLVQCLVHELGHIFGYLHTGWAPDVMSYVGPWYIFWFQWEPFDEVFWNGSSWMWQISRKKDKITYGGRVRKGIYKTKVDILPTEGTVIDLEFLRAEVPDRGGYKHVIVTTTLKGYRKKPLMLSIYRGDKVRKKKLIVRVSGFHYVFARKEYAKVIENYTVSDLYFHRQEDYEKLVQAVRDHGTPAEFHTMSYTHALWATIEVKGYESTDSEEPKTQTTKVWFAIRTDNQY